VAVREASGCLGEENDGGEGEEVDDEDVQGGKSKENETATPPAMSPKLAALLQDLTAMKLEDNNLKAVIFSQFTTFINQISSQLKLDGWNISRLQGSMTGGKKRSQELSRWRVPNRSGGNQVLIVSTKAGGQGLNLTEGSRVFLMDPLWIAAQEEQAMDRCHRLGQTKKVQVVRYVMKDSIEEKILKLQAKKDALNRGALKKLSAEEMRAARLAEMVMLFELKMSSASTSFLLTCVWVCGCLRVWMGTERAFVFSSVLK